MSLSTQIRAVVDKQFNLRTTQEIRNNTQFIYETNQKLQSHSQQIVALQSSLDTSIGESKSDNKSLEIGYSYLENMIKNIKIDTEKRVDRIETTVQEAVFRIQEKLQKFSEEYALAEDLEDKFIPIAEWIEKIEANQKKIMDYITSSQRLINANIEANSCKLRQELTPKNDLEENLKKEIQNMIEVMKVDFQGLIREIELLKKSSHYADKKFENLYTLIDRLKGCK